jgi:hypothetical protein
MGIWTPGRVFGKRGCALMAQLKALWKTGRRPERGGGRRWEGRYWLGSPAVTGCGNNPSQKCAGLVSCNHAQPLGRILLIMSEPTKTKRPASHRWLIGICVFMTLGFAVLLIDVFSGRSGVHPSSYWPLMAMLSFFPLTLFAVFLGRRQKWVYYFAAVMLAILGCRALYVSSLHVYSIYKKSPVVTPYFHLAQREKPLVVNQEVPVVKQILIPVATGFLILLFFRFTFGRQSLSYYGFDDINKPWRASPKI